MLSRMTLGIADFNRQVAQMSLDTNVLANDGANYTAILAIQEGMRDAILGVVVGVLRYSLIAGNFGFETAVKSNAEEAQVNIQFRAYYEDITTGRRFSVRIPCADLSLTETVTISGIDRVILPLDAGPGDTLKTAWDSNVYSEDGNPTVLTTVEYVE